MEIILTAVILGIVEGLTEFIPVSSTGHLIVFGTLLGFVGEKAASFEVFIQLGAILSVVVLYWKRFLRLIPGNNRLPLTSRLDGWDGLWRIAVATAPALIAGYVAHGFIKTYLFTPGTVTVALVVGGIGILLVEKYTALNSASLDSLTLRQALVVGLFQTLSLWPGVSRSGATIVGGLIMGLDRKSAAEFSFLIAVPVMIAATGYDLIKIRTSLTADDALLFAIGFVVSFVVALVTIAGFVRLLNRWTLAPFAWYRILVAPIFYLTTRHF